MRHQHDLPLRPLAQVLPHRLCAPGDRVPIRGPEPLLRRPVRCQQGEVQAVELADLGQFVFGGARVAGEVVAFLGSWVADDVLDTEALDGGTPAEEGRLEGAFERRGDDYVDFVLEVGDLGREGGGLLAAEGCEGCVEDCDCSLAVSWEDEGVA